MAPHASVMLDSVKARNYVTVDGNRIICGAPDCNYSVLKNFTRLALHPYSYEKAHSWKPGLLVNHFVMAGAGGAAVGKVGTEQAGLPHVTIQQRHHIATSIFRSEMPCDAFDSPYWRKSLANISSGPFNGPGHRRRVGGALSVESVIEGDSEVGAVLGGARTVSGSIYRFVDATGKVVQKVMFDEPAPCVVVRFRLRAAAASAENQRARLVVYLATPVTARVSRFDSFPGAARPSPEAFIASRQLQGFYSNNPAVMHSLRRLLTDTDAALFANGCSAHAANLVGNDLARQEPFRFARIDAVTIIVFFTRSALAMVMLLTNVHWLLLSGEKVPFMTTYSRMRRAGETASIASVIGGIFALLQTLSDNLPTRLAVVIPCAVMAAVREGGPLAGMERAPPFSTLLSKFVASLEVDNARHFTVAGVFRSLRLCLSTSFADFPVDMRTAIQSSIAARYSFGHDPVLVSALYLDPFHVEVRMQWGRPGAGWKTLLLYGTWPWLVDLETMTCTGTGCLRTLPRFWPMWSPCRSGRTGWGVIIADGGASTKDLS